MILPEIISRDYAGKELLIIGVLKGAFIFLSDLVRHLSIPAQIDFIRASSYGDTMSSSGKVALTHTVQIDVRGKHLLLVEDIVDTGSDTVQHSGIFSLAGACIRQDLCFYR